MAMKAVDKIIKKTVKEFLRRHIQKGRKILTNAFPALNAIKEDHIYEKRKTPPYEAETCLPKVHVVIAILKSFRPGHIMVFPINIFRSIWMNSLIGLSEGSGNSNFRFDC